MAAYSFNQFNQRGNPSNPEQDQVALFIDWDNLVISNYADRGGNRPDLEVLVRRAQQYGTVVIARAYAEWNITADRLEVYKSGIEPIYAPVFHADRDLSGQTSRGKSLADPVMVTDCIDFLHLLPQIGTYILVTGDKDMVPVVRLARLRGRRVVVIGPDYVANVLQQVSDEFIPYRFLLSQVVAAATDPYAAYYQQQGQYYPGQPAAPGFLPTQVPPTQPAPPAQQTGTDRRGRRLSGRRGQSSYPAPAPQPYARIVAPPPGGQPIAPNYYGLPNQPQPQPGIPGYPQPTDPYQPAVQPGTYPTQPQQVQPGFSPQPQQVQPGFSPQPQGVQPGFSPQPQQVQPGFSPQPQQVQPGFSPLVQPGYSTPQPTVQPGFSPQPVTAQPTPDVSQRTAYQSPSPVATPATSPASVITQSFQPQPATEAATPATATAGSKSSGGQNDFDEVKEVIRQIIAQRTASGRPQMRARDLKEELLRRIPNFSERRYGFSKFKALLNAAETAGILQIDQSGHILWVSAPGTPKMQFGAITENAAGAIEVETDEDEETDTETENQPASPTVMAELDSLDTQSAIAPENALTDEAAPITVEPEEAAVEAPEPQFAAPTSPLIEERTTSLVEAPIGAHRERTAPAYLTISTTETAPSQPAPVELGQRPALLDQPYYEEVIVLIDELRNRNRWLGYELLLSNVRDLLTKQMPEVEAKVQAGAILSKLLQDGIIKMAVEVHSRGARKMTVKVAHLQENNPAVRYTLDSRKVQPAATIAEAPAEPVSEVEPVQEMTYADVDLPTEADQEAASQPIPAYEVPDFHHWGSHYTKQAQPESAAEQTSERPEQAEMSQPEQSATTEAPTEPTQHAETYTEPTQQTETHTDSTDQVEEMGIEPVQAGSTEEVPAQVQAENPVGEAEGDENQAQPYSEVNGQEVNALVAHNPATPDEAGMHVQGEPDQARPDEEPAPAGGFHDTVELEAAPSPEHTNGHGHEVEGESKQVAGETLQPVLELDSEDNEESETEPEADGSEAEGEVVAPKGPIRRPRRRRTVAPKPEGQGESMGQPAERRPRLSIAQRPPRHRNK